MSELYKSLLIIYPEIILSFVAMILLMLGSFFSKKIPKFDNYYFFFNIIVLIFS